MKSTVVNENETEWICQQWEKLTSAGVINGEDPTQYPLPLLLLHIALFSSLASFFQFILKPFGLLAFIPQMLGGIVLGPSLLGKYKRMTSKLFYTRSLYLLDTYEALGFLFLSFITSAQIDLGMVRRAGRMAVATGVSMFIIPQIVSVLLRDFINTVVKFPVPDLQPYLTKIALLEATILFQVTFTCISDLKMLNSEIGKLALSSSMISNLILYSIYVLRSFFKYIFSSEAGVLSILFAITSQGASFSALLLVFRTILIRMFKKRFREGKKFKERYLLTVCVMVLFTGFYGEAMGLTHLSAAIALGLATPTEIMLELEMFKKISCFVDMALVPCFVIAVGRRVNVFTTCIDDLLATEFTTIVVHISKFAAGVIPLLYYKVPFSHAASFGLILNIQGAFNVQTFKRSLNSRRLNDEAFTYLVIMAVVHSAIYTSLVKRIYRPTSKYIAYQRRTIQHLEESDSELRVLACFREEEAVSCILNILEFSNPSRRAPISVFALNMEELGDQSIPVLIHHGLDRIPPVRRNKVDHIINAFRMYEQQNQEAVSVQCFTAVAPYDTIHDDVCSLALGKETSIVIIGMNKGRDRPFERVSRNILENAPCSVAILCNRDEFLDFRSIVERRLIIKICVLFIGGGDDREALAYGTRMAEHPNVDLHVIRLLDENNTSGFGELIERKLDLREINKFRERTARNEKIEIRELRISEALTLVEALKEIGKEYHLMIVGIRHEEDTAILEGLSEWSEREEIGILGDLLASSDLGITASVLAIQQQAHVVEEMMGSSSHHSSLKSQEQVIATLLPY